MKNENGYVEINNQDYFTNVNQYDNMDVITYVPKECYTDSPVVFFCGGTGNEYLHGNAIREYMNEHPNAIYIEYKPKVQNTYRGFTAPMVDTYVKLSKDYGLTDNGVTLYTFSGSNEESVAFTANLLSSSTQKFKSFTANYSGAGSGYFVVSSSDAEKLAEKGISVNLINNMRDINNTVTFDGLKNSDSVKKLIRNNVKVNAIGVEFDDSQIVWQSKAHMEQSDEIFKKLWPYLANDETEGIELIESDTGLGIKKDGVTFYFKHSSVDENGNITWTNYNDLDEIKENFIVDIYPPYALKFNEDSKSIAANTYKTNLKNSIIKLQKEITDDNIKRIIDSVKQCTILNTKAFHFTSSTNVPNIEAEILNVLFNKNALLISELTNILAKVSGNTERLMEINDELKFDASNINDIELDLSSTKDLFTDQAFSNSLSNNHWNKINNKTDIIYKEKLKEKFLPSKETKSILLEEAKDEAYSNIKNEIIIEITKDDKKIYQV